MNVKQNTLSIDDLNAILSDRVETLALHLVGDQPTSRRRDQMRFRRKGSLVVWDGGNRRGSFYDHEAGKGGDMVAFIAHMNGGDMKSAYHWARDWIGDCPIPTPIRPRPAAPQKRPVSDTIDDARRVWREAVPSHGTIVETYLASRGLRLQDDHRMLRFHPSCPRYHETYPAMIALMVDPETGEPTGVHRTFLLADGSAKIPLEPDKMMLGNAGVVQLYDAEGYGLGITEGIENALAVAQTAAWRPIWAATSSGGVSGFPVLPAIDALSIFADQDWPGMTAARRCAERWVEAGREARIIAPPSGDWNKTWGAAA